MIGADGSLITLNEVPKNVLELWEAGNYAFCLKKEATAELFKDYPKESIQSIIQIRTPIGYKAELEALNLLLKQRGQESKKK